MSDHFDALHRAGYRADCPACIANDAAIATDRASAERLLREAQTQAEEQWYAGHAGAAYRLLDRAIRAALRDTGPRLDSGIDALLHQIEDDAGWLHDHVPDYSPDGVATLRDITREIAKAAYQARARLSTPRTETPDHD